MSFASVLHRSLAAAALVALTCPVAHAAFAWTSVGSAGTPDESALASDTLPTKISLSSPYASLLTSPAAASAVVRYNVTAVFDRAYVFPALLQMRFLDNSANTRVVAVLKSYDTSNGAVSTLATVDSNTFPLSSGYQTQSSCTSSNGSINEFGRFAYWVEVTLSRTANTGSAVVAALRIDECVW